MGSVDGGWLTDALRAMAELGKGSVWVVLVGWYGSRVQVAELKGLGEGVWSIEEARGGGA